MAEVGAITAWLVLWGWLAIISVQGARPCCAMGKTYMAISKQERLAKIHADAIADFDNIQSVQREERMQALSDRRFYSITGAAWEGQYGEQFENKPKLEFNKVHLAVIRVVNEYRANRITVDFMPKDGSTNEKLADICDGLYRADEQDSTADEAYDNAFEEAVGGGYGAWRLRACYEDDEDDENEKQRIAIEPIFDADSSVFFDLDAKRQDKKDAKRCYVLTAKDRQAYIDEYDDDPATWPKDISQAYFDWSTPDVVYVCELYKVEEKTEVIHVFRGITDDEMEVPASELDEDEDKLGELTAKGFREVRQKRVKRRKVHKYLLSGSKVLEDCGYIAGKYIPIIPVYGKRWYIDNIERCMGHVRLAKDAQRLLNMQLSNLAEIAALSPREKPIFTPEQMRGHEMIWAEDNIKNYPYLLVNALRDADGNVQSAGPIGMTKPPSIPPAMAALAQISDQSLQDLLGNQQAGEQVQANMSGKAVELVQNRLDMQVFIYMSNLAKAMQWSGEVWLSMKKEITVEEKRKMKVVDEQGQVSSVEMNVPAYDPEKAIEYTENDLSEASFGVYASVGPSSTSRRAATVRALTGMMQITQNPEDLAVLGAMAMMNMEGEGLSETRSFYRKKMLNMGVVEPTPEEQKEMAEQQQAAANQPPDANTQYLLASAAKQEADARAVDSKIIQTLADAQLKGAQEQKTLAEIGQTKVDAAQTAVDTLNTAEQMPAPPFNQGFQ